MFPAVPGIIITSSKAFGVGTRCVRYPGNSIVNVFGRIFELMPVTPTTFSCYSFRTRVVHIRARNPRSSIRFGRRPYFILNPTKVRKATLEHAHNAEITVIRGGHIFARVSQRSIKPQTGYFPSKTANSPYTKVAIHALIA